MPRRRNRRQQPAVAAEVQHEGTVAQSPPTKAGAVVEVLDETEAQQAEQQDLEPESGGDAQYDLPWEVWVCVLSSMDDPHDLYSFGLACRLFQAITQTGMVWRQLLGSTYGWVLDQWQAHTDLKQLGWRDAYRVCRKTACARVNVRRLFQKGESRACSTNMALNLGFPFGCFAVDCTEVVSNPDLVAVPPQANGRANNIDLWERLGNQAALELPGTTPKSGRSQAEQVAKLEEGGKANRHNRLWVRTKSLVGHTRPVRVLHMFQGKTRLASGSNDASIKLWDLKGESNACMTTLHGHSHEVTSVQINNYLLVSGSEDRSVGLWDIAKEQQVHSFQGHSHFVTDVAMNRSGTLLLSGSWDNTIRLWDPRSGECNYILEMQCSVDSVAFNPTEDRVYFGPVNLSHAKQAPCWVDLRKVESTVRSRLENLSLYATSPKVAMMPISLFDRVDLLYTSGLVFKFDCSGKRELIDPPARLGYRDQQKQWQWISASAGACWTASGVIVSGGQGKLFFADPTCVPEAPWSNDEARAGLAGTVTKGLHLRDLRQPTPEEVAHDVATIRRQMRESRRREIEARDKRSAQQRRPSKPRA